MKPLRVLLPLLMLTASTAIAANGDEKESMLTLTNNNGLSNSAVNAIRQDSEGLMWFGTWDGLNRYDGRNVKQYHHLTDNQQSLSHQVIRSISEDNERRLWIATDYGINRLDRHTGTVQRYYLDYNPDHIYREKSFACGASSTGQVVASAYEQGLYLYDATADKFCPMEIEGCAQPHKVAFLLFDQKDYLWATTANGTVMRLAMLTDRRAKVVDEIAMPEGNLAALRYDGGKYIWTLANGRLAHINIYDPSPSITVTDCRLDGNLQAVCLDGTDLLVGTSTGCYRLTSNGLQRYAGITTSVLSLYKGTQEIIWIGTDGNGVHQCYSRQRTITCVASSRFAHGNNYPVRAILKDSHERLWVGTKGGGLSKIVHLGAQGLERADSYNVGAGHTYNSVLSLSECFGRIWVGTDGVGLHYFDEHAQKLARLDIPASPTGMPVESVYCILPSGKSSIYLGTSGNGLFRLDVDSALRVTAVANYLHSDSRPSSIGSNVIYALTDGGDMLWIATRGGGLSRLDKATGHIVNFTARPGGICSNDIITLLYDSNDRLWVGTTSGLSLLADTRADTLTFQTFDKKSGLPNVNIHSIKEDANHDIWVSTSQGIAKISTPECHITSYDYSDGLQDNEFADGAGFATADGATLYFGGVNGFNLIYPTRFRSDDFMPTLVVTGASVDGRPAALDGNVISSTYKDSYISLDFATVDYINNKKCQLCYKIESKGLLGYNSAEWVNLGANRCITFSQLPPGRYRLLVRLYNASQTWGEPCEYVITVSRPLWATWWAVCLYILAVVAIIHQVFRVKRARLMMRHELEMEKQETINKEKIHQAKLRFFTNIAHEFSNSITLIYGAVEQIFSKGNPNDGIRKQLLVIQGNAERMTQQIQELMEFRKAEQGYLHVMYERVDVSELICRTADNFIDLADSKKIQLTTDLPSESLMWTVDRSMLEKIIFNLISNALKYTTDGGRVSVEARVADDCLRVTCTNTGPGIPPENLSDIFNRFTILDNFERKLSQGKYSRNGIGLALCKDLATLMGGSITVSSEVDSFTSFVVTIPAHADSEIAILIANHRQEEEKRPISPVATFFGEQKPMILVIDDQADVRQMVGDILSGEYTVSYAADGDEALAMLDSLIPDAIICDVIMSGMNGLELMARIKADERTKYIPVVMLSGKSDVESRVEAVATGANVFVSKPFHPQYLKAVVDNIMANHSMMKHFSETSLAYKEKYNNVLMQKEDKAFIDSVIDLLSKHFSDENYSQDDMARDLAISRVQLYRKLKKTVNATPGDFIRSYRLSQAENMLLHSNRTIQEIMVDCGFHNKAYFYRLFQRTYNCSPRVYRANAANIAEPSDSANAADAPQAVGRAQDAKTDAR